MFQKKEVGVQKEAQKAQARETVAPDKFYARHRRLERRIADCEAKISSLRRDINRVDRKLYPDKDRSSLTPNQLLGGVSQNTAVVGNDGLTPPLEAMIKEMEGRYAV